MNIRYQIFVSSTYVDLFSQRKNVIDELNKVGYIAIGMEQFPASDESQMDYIEPVIDESDYYVVIVRGKYGKPAEDGLSYTEKEFEYATKQGKPTLAFIYGDYENLPAGELEQDPAILAKYQAFKQSLLQRKIVRFWKHDSELVSAVKDSLFDLSRRRPATGWIRGDNALDPKIYSQLEELRRISEDLRKENENLKTRLEQDKFHFPTNLQQGEDRVTIKMQVWTKANSTDRAKFVITEEIKRSWDRLLGWLSEYIYTESAESNILHCLEVSLTNEHVKKENCSARIGSFIQDVRYQFEALGIINTLMKTNTAFGDRQTLCWSFSELGRRYVATLNAAKRDLLD